MDGIELTDRAAGFLPSSLSSAILFLSEDKKRRTEEIRLRCGRNLTLTLNDGSHTLSPIVEQKDLEETIQRMTRFSYHSIQENLRYGFFSAPGGYRVGICGTAVLEHGIVKGLRNFSSLCIRIPHPVSCVSDALLHSLLGKNILVCSPPGVGKTTFLRELIRRFSEEGQRVALVDERGELAAMREGIPQFSIGSHTDVMELCPKNLAVELLLRSMSPQILALDELSAGDSAVLVQAAASGVKIVATAHGDSPAELDKRGIPVRLFQKAVIIRNRQGKRSYEQEELGC